jgi:hypothetical protein
MPDGKRRKGHKRQKRHKKEPLFPLSAFPISVFLLRLAVQSDFCFLLSAFRFLFSAFPISVFCFPNFCFLPMASSRNLFFDMVLIGLSGKLMPMKSKLVLASLCLLMTTPVRAAGPADPSPPKSSLDLQSSTLSDDSSPKDTSPYAMIVARNVFRLNPLPPPPPPATNDPASAAISPLKLTGLFRSGNTPLRALLANTPANATNTVYYNLAEGERQDTLEIIKIHEAEESVDVLYAGARSTILLKDSKPASTATAPGPGPGGRPAAQPGSPGFVPTRGGTPGAPATVATAGSTPRSMPGQTASYRRRRRRHRHHRRRLRRNDFRRRNGQRPQHPRPHHARHHRSHANHCLSATNERGIRRAHVA